MRRNVDKAHLLGIQAADYAPRFNAVFDKIIRVRIDVELDALALQDGKEFFHGTVESVF